MNESAPPATKMPLYSAVNSTLYSIVYSSVYSKVKKYGVQCSNQYNVQEAGRKSSLGNRPAPPATWMPVCILLKCKVYSNVYSTLAVMFTVLCQVQYKLLCSVKCTGYS